MEGYRFLRVIGDAGLVDSFFAGLRITSSRALAIYFYGILFLTFSGAIGAMGDGSSMIASSSTSTMYIKGAYGGLVIANGLRLKDMSVRCALIIDLIVFYGSFIRFET